MEGGKGNVNETRVRKLLTRMKSAKLNDIPIVKRYRMKNENNERRDRYDKCFDDNFYLFRYCYQNCIVGLSTNSPGENDFYCYK